MVYGVRCMVCGVCFTLPLYHLPYIFAGLDWGTVCRSVDCLHSILGVIYRCGSGSGDRGGGEKGRGDNGRGGEYLFCWAAGCLYSAATATATAAASA